jgi:hypothetical protein
MWVLPVRKVSDSPEDSNVNDETAIGRSAMPYFRSRPFAATVSCIDIYRLAVRLGQPPLAA